MADDPKPVNLFARLQAGPSKRPIEIEFDLLNGAIVCVDGITDPQLLKDAASYLRAHKMHPGEQH